MTDAELLELDPSNRRLIELLLRLECYVRRIFGLPVSSTQRELADTLDLLTDRTSVALNVQRLVLTNYLYDSYLRLLISGRHGFVQSLEYVGTLTFVWSLRRAFRLDPTLRRTTTDIRRFSEKLDDLRRASNIDILMDDSIAFLEASCRRRPTIDATSIDNDDDDIDYNNNSDAKKLVDDEATMIATTTTAIATTTTTTTPKTINNVETLNRLKTFYDVVAESRLFDHSDHYEEAFVPSYRFCDSRLYSFNMSRYIGHTMRENIRGLYKYISELIGDSRACPCVVIFNLFIRDNYLMYHSKSLRQSSFVSVRVTDGREIKLGYMIVTNNFPRVNSWFKSINNQLVKKSGKISIQHLDTFVRLMVTLLNDSSSFSSSSLSSTSSSLLPTSSSSSSSLPLSFSLPLSSSSSSRNNLCRKKKITASTTRLGIAKVCSRGVRKPLRRRQQQQQRHQQRTCARVTLSTLYRSVDEVYILSDLCNTRYISCKHSRVERTYEQLRSNDESATLIRRCLDCGRIV